MCFLQFVYGVLIRILAAFILLIGVGIYKDGIKTFNRFTILSMLGASLIMAPILFIIERNVEGRRRTD